MTKLQPCPLCGNEGVIAEGLTCSFSVEYQPYCRECGMTDKQIKKVIVGG